MSPSKFAGYLLANLLFCIWIGYLIDTWTNMTPFWIIAFTLYAIVGSFLIFIHRNKHKSDIRKD